MDIKDILSRLKGVRACGEKSWIALCPAHDDHNPSLSISEVGGKVLLYCHAGCSYNEIRQALGLSEPNNWATIVATYDYRDENGNLLYQVVRLYPKDFRMRTPAGNGSWAWTTRGVRKVLYKLPEILSRPEETVWIVEGEKDVDTLVRFGFLATTNVGGAGKWDGSYSKVLAGRNIIILPDNDAPGRAHALKVALSLHTCARTIKVVNLPGLPEGGDVSDWLAAGHTVDELKVLVEQAAYWTPPPIEASEKLEGQIATYVYRIPVHGIRISLRAVKLHSDGRLTAIIRIYDDKTGQRIAGSGQINLAAARTRNALAKDLEEQRPLGVWAKELDQLYTELEDRLLSGLPRLKLSTAEYPDPVQYLLYPFLPYREPTIFYGEGASGKSMLAMLIGLLMATGISHEGLGLVPAEQINVLYLDWERQPEEAKRRLYRLARGLGMTTPAQIYYRQCNTLLAEDVEAIAEIVCRDGIELLIVDSLLPAAGIFGRDDPAEAAFRLFAALRQLAVTPLVVAHHGKDRAKGIYGSIFYRNLASSIWRVYCDSEPGGNILAMGLIHDKTNISGKMPPFGVAFHFDDSDDGRGPIYAHPTDVSTIPGVEEAQALTIRILRLLSRQVGRPLGTKEIAEALHVSSDQIRPRLQELLRKGKVVRLNRGLYAAAAEEGMIVVPDEEEDDDIEIPF